MRRRESPDAHLARGRPANDIDLEALAPPSQQRGQQSYYRDLSVPEDVNAFRPAHGASGASQHRRTSGTLITNSNATYTSSSRPSSRGRTTNHTYADSTANIVRPTFSMNALVGNTTKTLDGASSSSASSNSGFGFGCGFDRVPLVVDFREPTIDDSTEQILELEGRHQMPLGKGGGLAAALKAKAAAMQADGSYGDYEDKEAGSPGGGDNKPAGEAKAAAPAAEAPAKAAEPAKAPAAAEPAKTAGAGLLGGAKPKGLGGGLLAGKAAAKAAGDGAKEGPPPAATPKAAAEGSGEAAAEAKPKGLGGMFGKKAGGLGAAAAPKVTFDEKPAEESSSPGGPTPKAGLAGLLGKPATDKTAPEEGASPAAATASSDAGTPKANPLLGGLGKAKSPGGLGGLGALGGAGGTPKAGGGLAGLMGGKAAGDGPKLSMTSLMMAKKTAAKVKEKAKRLREEKLAHLKSLEPLQKPNPIERKKRLRDPEQRALLTPLQRLVTSANFDAAIGLAIAMNVLFMGVEYQLHEDDFKPVMLAFLIIDLIFLLIFTVEVALRAKAFGFRALFATLTQTLDVVVVMTGIISEIIMPIVAGTFMTVTDSQSPLLNLVRSMRALRALRVLRVLTMFEQLWHVVELFFFSLTPLFWAVGFILVVIFMFAIFSIVLIGRSSMGDGQLIQDAQNEFYTTSNALITLFSIMTLDGWTTYTKPLFDVAPWTYFWFLFFISISAFSLMNLITVTVLETAREQQLLVQNFNEIDMKTREIGDLLEFPGTEEVTTKKYFVENWHTNRALRLLFEKLHLNASDAAGFFEALDIDESGGLDHFELATTYMELVTSVMNAPHNIALIRSACDPDEKSKILKASMMQSQQGRMAAEMRQARDEEKEGDSAERAKAQKDRDAMRAELNGMKMETTKISQNVTEKFARLEEMMNEMREALASRPAEQPRMVDLRNLIEEDRGAVSDGGLAALGAAGTAEVGRGGKKTLTKKKSKKKLVTGKSKSANAVPPASGSGGGTIVAD